MSPVRRHLFRGNKRNLVGFDAGKVFCCSLPLILSSMCIVLFSSSVKAALEQGAREKAKVNQDIVFLVDTSSSMRNIFEDIREAIRDYAHQAQPGDSIILISFGEKVNLQIRQKILSHEDVELVERELDLLEPNQYYSYLTGALDRGMEELRALSKKHPEHLRTMVLLSDGKNNPPPAIEEPVNFEELLKRYPGLLQGPNSAFFYLSLGDNPDPDVVKWMGAAKGTSLDVGKDLSESSEEKRQLGFAQVFVEPVSIDLGTVYGSKAIVPVSLAFFPARGDASGQGVEVSFRASYQENPSWKTLLEIKPAAVMCSKKPWNTNFSVEVESLHEGTVVGTLELKPLPGNVLFIDPPSIPVTITTRQPKITVEMRERLRFGPIYSGSAYRESKAVILSSNSPIEPRDVRVTPSIGLPDGITLATAIVRQESQMELQVIVGALEEFKASHSLKIEGTLDLAGANHTIAFSKDQIEITVEVGPPPAKSRIMELMTGWINSKTLLILIASAAAAGCLFVLIRYIKFRPTSDLEGKLVLINFKDKSFNSSRVISANLHSLGRTLGRDFITIGSAKEAGLTIPHESVAEYHCEISVRLEKGNKRIYIEPMGKNDVIVNLQKIDKPVSLSDRDLIEIGAYTFRFENPHPYKQIVVKYLDGRILKGTPSSWDIDGDGFNLLPRDALPGSSEEIYISFSELKAVYFVRDFDGQIGKKIVSPATQIHGEHMMVVFQDKEKIEGYTSETYNPISPRFYFFPADQSGNTISMLVERQHVQIELLAPGKPERHSASEVGTVLLGNARKSA